ncbi:hypothetical protein KBD69_02385 [Candidatus Woesebacteria bacterium]|nr:hypothetical protein [Candidatus Woesebacteria bacterium]
MWKALILPILWVAAGAGFVTLFKINPFDYLQTILLLGSLFLSVSLFANVQGIDGKFIKEYKSRSIILVSVGLVFKAAMLGLLAYLITHDLRVVLVATLMSQIDPSFTNWAQRMFKIKGRVAQLTLVESTFDDPVSTLLTVYIALPIALAGKVSVDFYLFLLLMNFLFVGLFLYAKHRTKIHNSFLPSALVVLGGIFNVFLGVALSGLFFQVKKKIFDEPINLITHASYIMIGMFLPSAGVEVMTGIIIGLLLVYVVRPLETVLFFRGFSWVEKGVIATAEQKGITTLLLLLIVQPQLNVVGIVLPAMLTVNALFFVNHYLLKVAAR